MKIHRWVTERRTKPKKWFAMITIYRSRSPFDQSQGCTAHSFSSASAKHVDGTDNWFQPVPALNIRISEVASLLLVALHMVAKTTIVPDLRKRCCDRMWSAAGDHCVRLPDMELNDYLPGR